MSAYGFVLSPVNNTIVPLVNAKHHGSRGYEMQDWYWFLVPEGLRKLLSETLRSLRVIFNSFREHLGLFALETVALLNSVGIVSYN